ncbi:hypothetical protein SERLA73DRAFT_188409 [Serpula lacrymans var. lacrymans S7.3]|uniref:Uncharacterized protein n=2 Tax=Serpula lacrymans var. lacrymans TaxID=341189 RepID=F8QBA1_SERL3|nr:uncharacterized protein SERLADRAFT_478508 [Serpula lacrymans var. lacrymans S7.9]EGN94487.1 hypothetical protein SERLA73DRAFT_188409 [Serpula lacrymans var. lacrymans S7.3]EGO19966.1 hypothetical protein SERLADRAFT_478508 [Serpula lacrymans var. lacrymans S7.9]
MIRCLSGKCQPLTSASDMLLRRDSPSEAAKWSILDMILTQAAQSYPRWLNNHEDLSQTSTL